MSDNIQIDKESSIWKAFIKGIQNSGEGIMPVKFNNKDLYLRVRHKHLFQFVLNKYFVEIIDATGNTTYFYVATKNPISVLELLAE